MKMKLGQGSLVAIGIVLVVAAGAQDVQLLKPEAVAQAEASEDLVQPLPEATETAQSESKVEQTILIEAAPLVTNGPQIVTQPTTVVEDSPLEKSRAEKLRNIRQNAEIETEQKIVEKLEESRLEDEKKRMDNLFGDKLESKPEIVVVPAAVAPAAAPAAPADASAMKAEIAESVKSDLQKIAEEEKARQQAAQPRYFLSGGLGFISYEAFNVTSDFAGGVSFGYQFRERMDLELGLLYSKHLTQDSDFTFQKFNQYNLSVGVRYGLLPYFIRPVVGAGMSYTRREYTTPYWTSYGDINTNAIDASFSIGVDADLGTNLVLSVDYKRFINLQNNIEDNDVLNLDNNLRLEDLDYDVTNVSLKILF
jgi:outer membrane protein W